VRGRKKEDRATGAYHESGHAVAVLLCGGLFIVSVSIRPDKTRGTGEWYSAGRTSYGPPFLDLDKKPGNIDDERWATVVLNIVEKQVKILMAGEALGGHFKTGHAWTSQNRPWRVA